MLIEGIESSVYWAGDDSDGLASEGYWSSARFLPQ